MTSLRSHEGYMLIDHSNSPGLSDALVTRQGLPPGSGRIKFESATFTCSHCETVVILNPNRTRSRGYCPRCDHYVCDNCEVERVAAGGACYPFKAKAYDAINKAIQASTFSEVLPLPLITSK